MNKLYAYALARKKTCLHAGPIALLLLSYALREDEEDEEHGKSDKIVFTGISFLVIFSSIPCTLLLFSTLVSLEVCLN